MTDKMVCSEKLNVEGKRALVVGLAKSGLGAVRLLQALRAKVFITDSRPEEELCDFKKKVTGEFVLFAGGHESVPVSTMDLAVISPGIPWNSSFLTRLRESGVKVVSELEFASQHTKAPVIAITGTNGKTTTATLLTEILTGAGKSVFTGGNIGVPLSEHALSKTSVDYIVCEVSSFQLEGIRRFRPKISLILNITPDHLDRHKDMDEYAGLKNRIFENQSAGDVLILNGDDEGLSKVTPPAGVKVRKFSAKRKVEGGAYALGEALFFDEEGKEKQFCEKVDISLTGSHNVENVLAAALAARFCGISHDDIRKGISGLTGIRHRMEVVAIVNEVTFINDSKGTNVGAAEKSIRSFGGSVILIAGGKDKGGDYTPLINAIKEKVKHLVLIGEAGEKISGLLNGYEKRTTALTMDEAVGKAVEKAGRGDVVLLSPACSSFDMFTGYEERGEMFKKSVEKFMNLNASATEEKESA
ncbi:MAG: UDP-N-acetylmuramoyl-L-alanine--D-glutamate ligase [Nitrospinota bacterium]